MRFSNILQFFVGAEVVIPILIVNEKFLVSYFMGGQFCMCVNNLSNKFLPLVIFLTIL